MYRVTREGLMTWSCVAVHARFPIETPLPVPAG